MPLGVRYSARLLVLPLLGPTLIGIDYHVPPSGFLMTAFPGRVRFVQDRGERQRRTAISKPPRHL